MSITYVSSQTLSIGPMIGGNFMSISNTSDGKMLAGLSAGGFGNYSFNEHLGINAKLLFSQMGTQLENSDNRVRLNYIQLPLSVVYFLGSTGNKIRPKLFAGPYMSYLIGAYDKNDDKIVDLNGNDIYFNTDFGGTIGAGLNFIIADRKWLNIDVSYSSSFYSILDVPESANRNSGLQLNAGVSFPIGK